MLHRRVLFGACLVCAAACSKGGDDASLAAFAKSEGDVASTASLLATVTEGAALDPHPAATQAFEPDGLAAVVVQLDGLLAAQKRSDATGDAKACTDAWYAGTDRLKGITAPLVKEVAKTKDAPTDSKLGTMMMVGATLQNAEPELTKALCNLAQTASTCVAPLKAASLNFGSFTLLAMHKNRCK